MEPLTIDVWADVACPWCWIGHRHLATAIAQEPEGSIVVRHRAFELRPPGTRIAHQLVKLAETEGLGEEALVALYRAQLEDGVDVTDTDQAVAVVAQATPLSAVALRAAVDEGAGELEVAADERIAQELGVAGAPFFLAGSAVSLSGAHEPEVMRRLFAAAREKLAGA
jgi:predicted DsbA family dithiol-disulfide isomerase